MANTGLDTVTPTLDSNPKETVVADKKIVWDKSGSRYYETGTSKGVLYPMTTAGSYGDGVAWNGLTAVTESPSGAEANDMYADDIKYATLRSAETWGGTIEAYTYPEEFAACDGSASPANVKGVYIGQQKRNGFGFSYVTQVGNDTATESDDGYKLHLVYGLTASPSEKSYATINDSPDAITFSWEVSSTPVDVDGYKPVSTITIDTTKLDTDGKTNLAKLEDILYGKGEVAPRLPLPTEVLTTMGQVA